MKRISRIGATALALALSVVFATPATVNAAGYPVKEIDLVKKKTNVTYESDNLITEDNKVIYQTTDEAACDAELAKYADDASISKTEETINTTTTYYIIQKTYKNEITGATSTKKDDVNPSAQYADDATLDNSVYVNVGEPTYLMISLINGDTAIKKVKSSKKSVLTAEIDKNCSFVRKTDSNVYDGDVSYNKDHTSAWYYKSTGEKVALPVKDGQVDKDSAEYKASNGSSAKICIKVTPKKAGKAKVKFAVYNKDGKKNGTITINVTVRGDEEIFKTLTFAGKSLIQRKYGDTNYINHGRRCSEHGETFDYNFTEKSKGKLVAKANKGYKIVKIQVGTYEKPTSVSGARYNQYSNSYYNEDTEYYSFSASGKAVSKHYDYNGDGDFIDTVNGQNEFDIGMKFKTVKSGKTIKLGQYGLSSDKTTTISVVKDSVHGNKTTTSNSTYYEYYAPTLIIITYYDQASKAYGQREYTLFSKSKAYKTGKKSKK